MEIMKTKACFDIEEKDLVKVDEIAEKEQRSVLYLRSCIKILKRRSWFDPRIPFLFSSSSKTLFILYLSLNLLSRKASPFFPLDNWVLKS